MLKQALERLEVIPQPKNFEKMLSGVFKTLEEYVQETATPRTHNSTVTEERNELEEDKDPDLLKSRQAATVEIIKHVRTGTMLTLPDSPDMLA